MGQESDAIAGKNKYETKGRETWNVKIYGLEI